MALAECCEFGTTDTNQDYFKATQTRPVGGWNLVQYTMAHAKIILVLVAQKENGLSRSDARQQITFDSTKEEFLIGRIGSVWTQSNFTSGVSPRSRDRVRLVPAAVGAAPLQPRRRREGDPTLHRSAV